MYEVKRTSFVGLEGVERGEVSGWSIEGFLLPEEDGNSPKNFFLPPPLADLDDFPRCRLKDAGGDLPQARYTRQRGGT